MDNTLSESVQYLLCCLVIGPLRDECNWMKLSTSSVYKFAWDECQFSPGFRSANASLGGPVF